MRIGVISDVHGNSTALKAVVNYIEENGIDKIIFLGDLVMNGPYPEMAMQMMKALTPIAWVKGNTDSWFQEIDNSFSPQTEREEYLYSLFQYAHNRLCQDEIDLISSKSDKQLIEIEGLKILCVHGSHDSKDEQLGIMTPSERLEQILNEIDADILLCGHSHIPFYTSYNGKKIINPGAAGLPYDGEQKASFVVLDIKNKNVAVSYLKLSYNIEEVIASARTNNFPYIDKYIKKLTEAR